MLAKRCGRQQLPRRNLPCVAQNRFLILHGNLRRRQPPAGCALILDSPRKIVTQTVRTKVASRARPAASLARQQCGLRGTSELIGNAYHQGLRVRASVIQPAHTRYSFHRKGATQACAALLQLPAAEITCSACAIHPCWHGGPWTPCPEVAVPAAASASQRPVRQPRACSSSRRHV